MNVLCTWLTRQNQKFYSFICSFVCPSIHSFVQTFIHSFIHSSHLSILAREICPHGTRGGTRSFVHSFIHSFIHPFIHSFIHFICLFQHERFVHMAHEAEPEVLFVGDSLIQNMQLFEVTIYSNLLLALM